MAAAVKQFNVILLNYLCAISFSALNISPG